MAASSPNPKRSRNRQRVALATLTAVALGGASVWAVQAGPAAAETSGGTASANEGAVATARQLGTAFAEVAERVSPAVVSLRVEARVPTSQMGLPFKFFGPPGMQGPQMPDHQVRQGNGSGVIIGPDGHILTNNHVVENATRITVVLQDGRHLEGEVVGTDPATDLAVVKVEAKGLPTAEFADSDAVHAGEWSVAIGSPFGLDYTVTTGVVSAVGRAGFGAAEIEDFIQTDAAINPGNSGGPLVDLEGKVIGINTMIVGRGSGIGFAVPANLARHVARQIISDGHVRRAWIGVSFQSLTPELASHFGVDDGVPRGALVSGVVPGGPAARAGLQPGDVVLSVDGKPIRESHELLRAVIRKPVGDRVQLEVLRNGNRRRLALVTTERPDAEDGRPDAKRSSSNGSESESSYGLQLAKLTPELAKRLGVQGTTQGVVVAGVAPGRAAARAGLRRGDVVVEADNAAVENVATLKRALKDGKAVLRVLRNESSFYTVLEKDD
ncbi:MAG: Do family serine endopeptidase [Myxococcota bacterium]